MIARRDRWILLATLTCAVGAPAGAASWLSARTTALAGHVGAVAGVPVRIARVDADLTFAITLSDVALGELVAAERVEASIALDSLLSGTLRADEIRVAAPRVTAQVDRDGDSDLARLGRTLLHHAHDRSRTGAAEVEPAARRLRRIRVTSGVLTARIAGLGELAARGVEIVPRPGGVRITTGAVQFDGRTGPVAVALGFQRASAELSLPHLRIGRVLAVGGAGAVTPAPAGPLPDTPQRKLLLRDVAAGRLAPDGPLELRAAADDDGVPRPLAIELGPRDLAIGVHGERIPLGVLARVAPRGLELAGAHGSGSVAVHHDAERWRIDLDSALDGVIVDHRALAATAVPLSGAIRAAITVSPDAVAVSRGAVELGAARLAVTGWLRRGAPVSGQIELALATAGCGDLLAALPGELRGALDGMVLDGAFGARLRLAVDLAAPEGEGVALTASLADTCRVVAEPPAADVARLAAPGDHAFPDGSRARIGKGEPGWIALGQLPSHVTGAFVSAEDARFFQHAGFDLDQIARSLEIDLREHRLARGGSTISQQLIKNAFLSQRRSFDRKLQEAVLTWRLESRLDKRKILERYLNVIELGPRVYGLTAAARHWFGTSPRELSVRQAAFLAALTAEPATMSRRVRRAGGLDPDSASRVDVVLRAMRRDGVIDAVELDAARTARLHFAAAVVDR